MFLRPRASAMRTSESTLTLSAIGWIADVNVGITSTDADVNVGITSTDNERQETAARRSHDDQEPRRPFVLRATGRP